MPQIILLPEIRLLQHFAPELVSTAEIVVAQAASDLDAMLPAEALADLSDGQYTALADRVLDIGAQAFAGTRLAMLVANGNLTLPIDEFQKYGPRGLAELQIWLM